jgi:large subunit ribosomal protein L35
MKRKTNKSAKKRIKVTGKKKMLFRPVSQDHFNAKDTGKKTMKKRKSKKVAKNFQKTFAELMPYQM